MATVQRHIFSVLGAAYGVATLAAGCGRSEQADCVGYNTCGDAAAIDLDGGVVTQPDSDSSPGSPEAGGSDANWQCCDSSTPGDDAGGPETDGASDDAADASPECGDASYCGAGQGCVDTTTSASNCGGCGKTCTAPSGGTVSCANSKCVPVCPSGSEDCKNQCISDDNLNNCGGCGNVCPGPASGSNGSGVATCVDAGCVLTCASGAHVCEADCLLNTDPPSTDSCIISATYGVFVSSSGNDTTGNGTPEAPYATIGKAAAAAKSAGLLDVFACGTFTSSVTINATMDGRNIYGGFNCTSTTWTWSASTNAVVAPTSPGLAMTVTGLTTGVSFTNFAFNAMAAPANTGDSVLAVLVDSSVVTFSNVTITAGAGATGSSGNTVANYTAAQANAGNPANGFAPGGAQICTCVNPSGSQSEGAHGGTGDPATPTAGGNGTSTPSVPSPTANGGNPQTLIAACGDGLLGATGAAANGGVATSLSLSLTSSGLVQSGGTGGPGGYGDVAQGGGGGGGGAENTLTDGGTTGGGGGGGCGGCGGGYGTGGSPGGSSIALASVDSTVTLSACVLTANAGGAGGTGGAAQPGQSGGSGADGSTPGCPGGNGGTGGPGGGGAGGAGGDSFGIAYTGQIPTLTNGTHVNAGSAGGPGSAGSGGSAQPGNDGTSSTTPVLL